MRNTLCGTPIYLAPEIRKKQLYDYTVDVWSTGILAYEMVCGLMMPNVIIALIEKSNLILPNSISKEAQSFIKFLLREQPS